MSTLARSGKIAAVPFCCQVSEDKYILVWLSTPSSLHIMLRFPVIALELHRKYGDDNFPLLSTGTNSAIDTISSLGGVYEEQRFTLPVKTPLRHLTLKTKGDTVTVNMLEIVAHHCKPSKIADDFPLVKAVVSSMKHLHNMEIELLNDLQRSFVLSILTQVNIIAPKPRHPQTIIPYSMLEVKVEEGPEEKPEAPIRENSTLSANATAFVPGQFTVVIEHKEFLTRWLHALQQDVFIKTGQQMLQHHMDFFFFVTAQRDWQHIDSIICTGKPFLCCCMYCFTPLVSHILHSKITLPACIKSVVVHAGQFGSIRLPL
jgi:hypothetical protein